MMPYQEHPTYGNGKKQSDKKCPDGFTCEGWRKIHKGGYVRFCGDKHYHKLFQNWIGMWVYVQLEDCWGINVGVYPDNPYNAAEMLLCANEGDWFKRTE